MFKVERALKHVSTSQRATASAASWSRCDSTTNEVNHAVGKRAGCAFMQMDGVVVARAFSAATGVKRSSWPCHRQKVYIYIRGAPGGFCKQSMPPIKGRTQGSLHTVL